MTSPRGRPPSVTRPSPASSVSRAVSRTCAPAPATAGSRPRGSRARRSSRSSRTSSASSGRRHRALVRAAIPVPGLVQQQHRDAVAHREGAVAGGAEQLARRLVHGQRAVVGVRAGQDLQQLRVEAQRSARTSSCRRSCAHHPQHLVAQLGHPRLVRRLDVEPQQRLGVAGPQVEPGAVGQLDGQPVQLVDGRRRPARRTSSRDLGHPAPAASATVELISPEAAYRL